MPEATACTIAACGITLHALEAGSGPLLVLVSGWPQTLYAWRHVMPALAAQFHVVAVDLPGLGESDAAADYDAAAIALHLDAVLDAFGAADCLLVTHDIGAWVGYAYAARRPQRVRALVLADAAIPGLTATETYRFSPQSAVRSWHFAFNFVPGLSEMLIGGREREFLTWLYRSKTVDFDAAFDAAAIDHYVNAYAAPGRWASGLGYYRAIFASAAQNQATAASRLTMPVLAIGGETGLGEAMAASLRPAADHVEGVVIAGCGHYIPEEKPAELLQVVLPFCLRFKHGAA